MAAKGLFGLASLILVGGGLVFMFLILLAGAINNNTTGRFYFLEADTSLIPNAPALARWTYWNVCPTMNGRLACRGPDQQSYSKVHPAFPFNPPGGRNFDTTEGVPEAFIGTSYYFLMTRFSFSFMLIALFFAVFALFSGLLALCTRLGAYLSGLLTGFAMIFQALNAALMTVAFVKGRNHFRRNGQDAHIGKYAFGFEWAAFACFFVAMILFCIGGGSGRNKTAKTTTKKGGFFGGRRSKSTKSTRSRGSFVADKEYS